MNLTLIFLKKRSCLFKPAHILIYKITNKPATRPSSPDHFGF